MLSTIDLLSRYSEGIPIGVYIHIPFCIRKCKYCDFFSVPINKKVPDEYIKAVKYELRGGKYGIKVKSIYIGGGSPSLLAPEQVRELLGVLRYSFDFQETIEVSIEINPEDIDYEWLKKIREVGVNRISVGVQSFHDEELEYLGRRHDSSKAKLVCEWISNIFDNWSLDLIYGLRGADVKKWVKNLEMAIQYGPPHISTYCLTIEEGTSLWEVERTHEIDEDMNLQLYKTTHRFMCRVGYRHYEISNFSKPKMMCRHNLIYWKNEPYIGLGAGAYSFIPPHRCGNPENLERYMEEPGTKSEVDTLDTDIIKKETLIQHFRLKSGISEKYYYERFRTSIWEDFGREIRKLYEKKLINLKNGVIHPTLKGFYLNNEIGLEIL